MTAQTNQTFFDGFFYFVSLFVFLLVFIDWLIGEEGRISVKNKVADWWVHIEGMSFTGLAAEDAGRIRRILVSIFGAHWYSPRALMLVIFLSIFITNLAFLVGHSVIEAGLWRDFYDTNSQLYPYPPWLLYVLMRGFESAFDASTYYPDVGRYLVFNAAADLISLYITIYLLRMMERSTKAFALVAIILFDVLVVFILTALVFDIGMRFVWFVHPNYQADIYYLINEKLLIFSPKLFYEYAIQGGPPVGGLLARIVLLALFISSALPTIAHIVMSSLFLLSKILRPVLKPVVSILLERLAESKKGVLTQIALFSGAVAKATQEGIKMFW